MRVIATATACYRYRYRYKYAHSQCRYRYMSGKGGEMILYLNLPARIARLIMWLMMMTIIGLGLRFFWMLITFYNN